MTTHLRILRKAVDDSVLVESFVRGRPDGTKRIYVGEVRAYLELVGKPIDQHRATDLRAYIQKCREAKLRPATIHRKVVILKSFFAFLHGEGELPEDPMARVDVPPCPPPGQARGLTQEQARAFFGACTGVSIAALRDRALFLLMASTGLRISEARGLSVRDVSEAEEPGWKVLRVTGKGEKVRDVHVRPEVWEVVLAYLQRRRDFLDESSPLFAAVPRGKPIRAMASDRRLSVASIFARFKRLAKKAGLPKEASPHSLRTYFACMADSAGASVESVRIALGHSGLGTTQRYLLRVRKGINEAFAKAKLPKLESTVRF